MRQIIDLPRVFMLRAGEINWDIDFGGQSAGADAGGGDQVVVNQFPRFVGQPTLILPQAMIGHFRAIRARARGRQNAWRVPMVDPVSHQSGGDDWRRQFAAWVSGTYAEPRPTVTAVVAASAGATTLQINETALRHPVRVGSFLSYADWPFIVTGRSGNDAAVTLQVEMLRTAIPAGGLIDVNARGLFIQTDQMAGNPSFALNRPAEAQMSFSEWITR
ncbi:MAG: hypothetical protein ACRCSU_04900 [Paracoccaceae bacterium]